MMHRKEYLSAAQKNRSSVRSVKEISTKSKSVHSVRLDSDAMYAQVYIYNIIVIDIACIASILG